MGIIAELEQVFWFWDGDYALNQPMGEEGFKGVRGIGLRVLLSSVAPGILRRLRGPDLSGFKH